MMIQYQDGTIVYRIKKERVKIKMHKDLKDFVSDWEEELNVDLMNKAYDAPLVDYIVDSWRSLEVVPQITFKGYEYTEEESEIDINAHIFKREKKKKKKERYDVKFINDDRCGKLTVHLEIKMKEKDPKTNESTYQIYPIKKSMLIPLQDEKGYYYIKGHRYYLLYQLLEKSTYTSSQCVTLKSLMPVSVKRNIINMEDTEGNFYTLPTYSVFVFRKEIPVILFYLAHGIEFTLSYLNLIDVVDFVPDLNGADYTNYVYFMISSKCFIKVDRVYFEDNQYIRSIVGGFGTVCSNRTTIDHLYDPKQWIKKITNPNNYEKGLTTLKYFNRLLDRNTQKDLLIPEYHKKDIYAILRWIMQEFSTLRRKDNCDLANKRLRCNECISSLMDKEFSRRLNRPITMGDKVTIDVLMDIFKFPGDRKYVS